MTQQNPTELDNKRISTRASHPPNIEENDYEIENEIVDDSYVSKIFDYRQNKVIYQNIHFKIATPSNMYGFIVALDGKDIDDKKAILIIKPFDVAGHIKIIIKNIKLMPVIKDGTHRVVVVAPRPPTGGFTIVDC